MVRLEAAGLLLAARPFQEHDALVSLLTRDHGLMRGLVKGGLSRGKRGQIQPGTQVHMFWSARLEDQLGHMDLSPETNWPGRVMDSAARLAALTTTCELLALVLSERDAVPTTYDGALAWLETLPGAYWGEGLVVFELALLASLGFALDLEHCVVSGDRADLAYVSPKSGRAVSRMAAQPYANRLLPLPAFLIGEGQGGPQEVIDGLTLTGHFLAKHLFHPRDRDLPPSRIVLLQRLERRAQRLSQEVT